MEITRLVLAWCYVAQRDDTEVFAGAAGTFQTAL